MFGVVQVLEVRMAIVAAPEGIQHARVLVVDGDADVVNLLSTSLTFQGFTVDTATNGPAALGRRIRLF